MCWAYQGRRLTVAQRIYAHMTDNVRDSRCGARPLETHQGGRVPGPMPQRGPPQATGGPRAPFRGGARRRVTRVRATGNDSNREVKTRPLRVLQWNAEGVSKKKLPLAERLHKEDIDIACIQETHLTDNLRLTVRGYQTYRVDREERHKGGVLILVRNNIPAQQICVNTDGQAEITGVDITVKEKQIRIYNLYCPPDRQLSLHTMDIPQDDCLVFGDFNSHSHSWGYSETDARGEEVEDWQIDKQLHLLNNPEDPPTFFSRRWLTSTTPDLAFATNNLQTSAERTVLNQLAGSDHKPVKISFNLSYQPEDCRPLPRWNYRKAKWEDFALLTNEYTANVNTRRRDANLMTKEFNAAIIRAASEAIPRGARKNYRPYWTEELQKLEDQVNTQG